MVSSCLMSASDFKAFILVILPSMNRELGMVHNLPLLSTTQILTFFMPSLPGSLQIACWWQMWVPPPSSPTAWMNYSPWIRFVCSWNLLISQTYNQSFEKYKQALIKQDVTFSFENSPKGGELVVEINQTSNAPLLPSATNPISTTVPRVTSAVPVTISEGHTTPVLGGSIVGGIIGGIFLGVLLSRIISRRSASSGLPSNQCRSKTSDASPVVDQTENGDGQKSIPGGRLNDSRKWKESSEK